MLFTRTNTNLDQLDDRTDDPARHRSLLVHGLSLTVRRFPAVLWAFVFNLFFAAITTSRIASTIGSVTDASLASQPLHHGFDVATLGALSLKLSEGAGLRPSFTTSIVLYYATYFLLVPGTLLCYQTGAPARLSTLVQAGILHFWRFLCILLLSLIVMGLILAPLAVIYSKYDIYLDEHVLGRNGFLLRIIGMLVLALVAAVLRLYFDLVEVYTVQLGLQMRTNGRSDRRVRRTLLPALRALGRNFLRAYETFILLAILGIAAVTLTTGAAVHTLAQPNAWQIFLLTQLGLFLMLFTRFWQRGAETTLSLSYPIPVSDTEAPLRQAGFIPAPSLPPINAPEPPPPTPVTATPFAPTPPPIPLVVPPAPGQRVDPFVDGGVEID